MTSNSARQRSKGEIVASIATLLGAPVPPMSHGGREPRAILDIVNDRLGLGFQGSNKVALASQIVNAAGLPWTPDCWSCPPALTQTGLERLEAAVLIFLAPLP